MKELAKEYTDSISLFNQKQEEFTKKVAEEVKEKYKDVSIAFDTARIHLSNNYDDEIVIRHNKNSDAWEVCDFSCHKKCHELFELTAWLVDKLNGKDANI